MLLFFFAYWWCYELIGTNHARSMMREVVLLVVVIAIAISGAVTRVIVALRRSLPWSLFYWLGATINALGFILFSKMAWDLVTWAIERFGR